MGNLTETIANRVVWPVVQARLFDRIRPWICRTPVFQLEGKTKRSKHNLCIVVFARKETAHYFSDISYSKKPEMEFLGKIAYHNVASVIAKQKPDMVLAEFDEIFSRSFSRVFLLLPYLDSTLDISPSWKTLCARMRSDRRRDISKIEKLPYTYETTRDPKKFNFFYYKMYLPYCSERHQKQARSIPVSYSRKVFQKGGLLLVKLNDQYVSGILYGIDDCTLLVPQHALYLGRDSYMAGRATYYFLIRWAKQKGYQKIDFGSTPPFINDGLFRYKKSWGMKISTVSRFGNVLALRFCNFREAVRDFLVDNPFIFTGFGGLRGLVFLGPNNANPDYLCPHRYAWELSDLIVFYPASNPPNGHCAPISKESLTKMPSSLKFLIKLSSKNDIRTGILNPPQKIVIP